MPARRTARTRCLTAGAGARRPQDAWRAPRPSSLRWGMGGVVDGRWTSYAMRWTRKTLMAAVECPAGWGARDGKGTRWMLGGCRVAQRRSLLARFGLVWWLQ